MEREQDARRLAIKMRGLKEDIRRQTDPHRPIEALDLPTLQVALDGLAEANEEYNRCLAAIAALREDLGLPRYEER